MNLVFLKITSELNVEKLNFTFWLNLALLKSIDEIDFSSILLCLKVQFEKLVSPSKIVSEKSASFVKPQSLKSTLSLKLVASSLSSSFFSK